MASLNSSVANILVNCVLTTAGVHPLTVSPADRANAVNLVIEHFGSVDTIRLADVANVVLPGFALNPASFDHGHATVIIADSGIFASADILAHGNQSYGTHELAAFEHLAVKCKFNVSDCGMSIKADATINIGVHAKAVLSDKVQNVHDLVKVIAGDSARMLKNDDTFESSSRIFEEDVKKKLENLGPGLIVHSVTLSRTKQRRRWLKSLLAGIGAVGAIATPVVALLNDLGLFQ